MYSKVIVLDLDGTTLKTDKTISEETIKALEKCKEKNMCIVLATARSERAAQRYISQIKPQAVITSGGSLVKLEGEVVYEKILSVDTTNRIIQRCLQNGTGTISVENNDGYFENVLREEFHEDYTYTKYTDFSKDVSGAYKITVEIGALKLAEEIAAEFEECSLLCYTGEIWRRFAHKESNKINALNVLLEKLNLQSSDAISFGDDYNDIEMTKYCGIGVAMENAIDELKSVADYVTKTNDNHGVAYYINKFLL